MLTTSDCLDADAVIFDLEDAVSVKEKDSARILVSEALLSLPLVGIETTVRVNPLDTPYWKEDLLQVVPAAPDAIVVPKASVSAVKAMEEVIAALEEEHGLKKRIKLHLLIESARALVDLKDIVSASDRVASLLLGAEDLASDLGIKRTAHNKEIEYARYLVATMARAYGVDALDTPYTDMENFKGLEEDTKFARSIGFTGRLAINPRQIEVIHQVFSPTEEEIVEAENILLEAEEAERQGLGVFSYKGKMVDLPVIHRAEKTLEKAKKWGLRR